ncbi:hypothetical protein PPSIR1_23774 [Plesiocystis pacifica SIR-1]|uniref:Type III secretion protein n=1 Tax=Plesiocystis pacifica SIR-1 TaxID=391625 RepID=A6GCE9_9BACT|nr:flagellar biosynthetic protein FliR [Plesiocystis pacifica]EDM76406.1 hypothetical protein PPSIR1_23774 [Plesiocystis pacifica SIR-1]
MSAWLLALASARVFAIVRAQISWRAAVGQPRWELCSAILAVGLSLAWLPALGLGIALERPPDAASMAVAIGVELLIGAVMGAGASVLSGALVGASQSCEARLGAGPVGLEPGTGGSLSALLIAASLAASLSLGLHLPALVAMRGLLTRVPLGAGARLLDGAGASLDALAIATELGGVAFEACVLGLALATPVLLTRAVVDLGVGVLGRGPDPAPAVVEALSPGLRLLAALVALGAAWSIHPEAYVRYAVL